jgi:hypothetical protein
MQSKEVKKRVYEERYIADEFHVSKPDPRVLYGAWLVRDVTRVTSASGTGTGSESRESGLYLFSNVRIS